MRKALPTSIVFAIPNDSEEHFSETEAVSVYSQSILGNKTAVFKSDGKEAAVT